MFFSTKLFAVCIVLAVVPRNDAGGLTSEEAIKLALELGAPFAKTALDRLHGNIFGTGRAARSSDVIVFNKSSKSFRLTANSCDHGGYTTDLFPEPELDAKLSTVFGMESHGILTGLECTTTYTSSDGTFFAITVDNPYVGSNSVRESYSPSLRLLATDGIGENNQVRWIIEDN